MKLFGQDFDFWYENIVVTPLATIYRFSVRMKILYDSAKNNKIVA